MIVITAGFPH